MKTRNRRTWRITDIVVDKTTGRLRESALFSVATKIAVLYSYLKFVNATNFETMTFVVGCLMLGHEVGARVLNQKQQRLEKDISNADSRNP